MPTFIATIGSTLISMIMALLTGPAVKWFVVEILENAVSTFERRAKKTESTEDDAWAVSFRRVLNFCKEQWKV